MVSFLQQIPKDIFNFQTAHNKA